MRPEGPENGTFPHQTGSSSAQRNCQSLNRGSTAAILPVAPLETNRAALLTLRATHFCQHKQKFSSHYNCLNTYTLLDGPVLCLFFFQTKQVPCFLLVPAFIKYPVCGISRLFVFRVGFSNTPVIYLLKSLKAPLVGIGWLTSGGSLRPYYRCVVFIVNYLSC